MVVEQEQQQQLVPAADDIQQRLHEVLRPLGFQTSPFLVGWYNSQVGDSKFRLDFPASTLAFIVISEPSMFEKAFIPYLREHWPGSSSLMDPVDECMMHCFSRAVQQFRPGVVHCLHDFQLAPNRRPKILVQTAGHVAGAVRFYQKKEFPQLAKEKDIFPVCHHPRFGGWFALRGVLIFQDVECPDLLRKEPDTVLSEEEACRMLQLYNENWQDGKWRNVGSPAETYSDLQQEYFSTLPGDRAAIIQTILLNTPPSPSVP